NPTPCHKPFAISSSGGPCLALSVNFSGCGVKLATTCAPKVQPLSSISWQQRCSSRRRRGSQPRLLYPPSLHLPAPKRGYSRLSSSFPCFSQLQQAVALSGLVSNSNRFWFLIMNGRATVYS